MRPGHAGPMSYLQMSPQEPGLKANPRCGMASASAILLSGTLLTPAETGVCNIAALSK